MTESTIRPYVSAAEAKRREQARVKAMIERDRQERMREIERAAAEIEVSQGRGERRTVLASAINIEPTDEWLTRADGEVIPFSNDADKGLSRTVRHVRMTPILRMLRANDIDNDQYHACHRYAEMHEIAGLEGSIRSADLSVEVRSGGDRTMFTERQQDAQRELRRLRACLEENGCNARLFEAVVIGNLPLMRASKYMKRKRPTLLIKFRKMCDIVGDEMKNSGNLA